MAGYERSPLPMVPAEKFERQAAERVNVAPGRAMLTVGSSHDPLEQEADRRADAIVRSLAPTSVAAMAAASTTRIRRSATPVQPVVGAAGGALDGELVGRIRRRAGGGAPLHPALRSTMEGAFGTDLGHVRLHADAESAALNEAVGARAFTFGSDIHLGAGAPDLGSTDGTFLLAHELTHVVQQTRIRPTAARLQRTIVGGRKGEAVVHNETKQTFKILDVPKEDAVERLYLLAPDDGGEPFLVYGDIRVFDLVAPPPRPTSSARVPVPTGDAAPDPNIGVDPTSTEALPTPLPPTHMPPPGRPGAIAKATRRPAAEAPDWNGEKGIERVRAINMQNCSWATLATVLGKSQEALTWKWQAEQGVLSPQERLLTERAWAQAMSGLDKLQSGAMGGPVAFDTALGTIDLRLPPGSFDVAQSYGVQKMVFDAVVASGGQVADVPADPRPNRVYRLGDSGTDQFVAPDAMIAAMRAFPEGTSYVVFLHGRTAEPSAAEAAAGVAAVSGGHYVSAELTGGKLAFFDAQFVQGTTKPRGPMMPADAWPKIPVGSDLKYKTWVNGSFIAIAPKPIAAPVEGLVAVTASSIASYRATNVEAKVPTVPAWLLKLKVGDALFQNSASKTSDTGEGRVTAALSDGKLFEYSRDKGGWVVNVEPVVARKPPPEKVAPGTRLTMPPAFAGLPTGTKGTATVKKTMIPVLATDLMLPADVGKVTHTPPAWYAQLVTQVASGIARDLASKSGELTKKDHGFVGPGRHVYDDGAVIAMASGLSNMLATLGLAQGSAVIVPELNKTMFLLDLETFALVKSLEDRVTDLTAATNKTNRQKLRTDAIAKVRQTILDETGKADERPDPVVVEELLEVHGKNPGYTKSGVVVLNMDKQRNLADDPSRDVQAFVHLVVHEFVHANSEGGGAVALDKHGGLNQDHEEGVTDLIARAISDAINLARESPDLDKSVADVVQRTVPKVATMTFGSNGGVRYQSEVDLVVRRIGDLDMLRNVVAKAYFGGDNAAKSAVAKALV